MPFIPAPNIVEVELRCLFAGQRIENRFMIDALTAVTPTIVDDITNLVSVWAQGNYFQDVTSSVQLAEVLGTDLTVADGVQHSIVPSGTVVGSLGGTPMPNEVTFCITHKTGSRGRSARGRSYVLGLAQNEVSGNNLLGARADALVSDFNDLVGVMTDNGYAWVVVSFISGGVPRPGGPVYYPITTNAYTDLVVDSMRRRKPGVGS